MGDLQLNILLYGEIILTRQSGNTRSWSSIGSSGYREMSDQSLERLEIGGASITQSMSDELTRKADSTGFCDASTRNLTSMGHQWLCTDHRDAL